MSKQRARNPGQDCSLVHYSPAGAGTLVSSLRWAETMGLTLPMQQLDYDPFETRTVQQRSHWLQVPLTTVE